MSQPKFASKTSALRISVSDLLIGNQMVRGHKALLKDLTAGNSWSRRGDLNPGPADYESCARVSRINNFKQLGVQDAAKRDIS